MCSFCLVFARTIYRAITIYKPREILLTIVCAHTAGRWFASYHSLWTYERTSLLCTISNPVSTTLAKISLFLFVSELFCFCFFFCRACVLKRELLNTEEVFFGGGSQIWINDWWKVSSYIFFPPKLNHFIWKRFTSNWFLNSLEHFYCEANVLLSSKLVHVRW